MGLGRRARRRCPVSEVPQVAERRVGGHRPRAVERHRLPDAERAGRSRERRAEAAGRRGRVELELDVGLEVRAAREVVVTQPKPALAVGLSVALRDREFGSVGLIARPRGRGLAPGSPVAIGDHVDALIADIAIRGRLHAGELCELAVVADGVIEGSVEIRHQLRDLSGAAVIAEQAGGHVGRVRAPVHGVRSEHQVHDTRLRIASICHPRPSGAAIVGVADRGARQAILVAVEHDPDPARYVGVGLHGMDLIRLRSLPDDREGLPVIGRFPEVHRRAGAVLADVDGAVDLRP